MTERTLPEMVRSLGEARVLVLGDPICDWYSFGRVERLSQEAPGPVYLEDAKQMRDGGAMNVYRNLQALGARARMIVPDKPWSVKHRYMVGHHQVFRHDVDVMHDPFTLEGLAEHLDWAGNIVLADYGKGCLSHAFCQELIEETRKRDKHVLVDPRGGDWDKYCGATVIFPNQDEWSAHHAIRTGTQPVFPYVVRKRGALGIELLVDGRSFRSYPAQARQVFDVTGAGDTVIATFAAATWHRNHSLLAGVHLANVAAGIVVGKLGTATVTQQELLQAVENDNGPRSEAAIRTNSYTQSHHEAGAAGEAREPGRKYRAQDLEADRDRNPLPPP